MKSIVLAFTLKGQDEQKILQTIETVSKDFPDAICIHGFLPRKVVVEKGFPTSVVDALDKYFPVQLNMWNEKPLRTEMAEVAKKMNSTIVVIGEIKEGVAEEVELYKSMGLVNISTWAHYELK